MILGLSLLVTVASARTTVPTHIVDDEYIKEWLVLGPFPKELDTDFLQAYGGEVNTKPYKGMEIVAPNGGTLTWKRYQSESDVVDLLQAIGQHEDAVAYAFCHLLSSKDQQRELLIRHDDSVKVWLNGELIHSVLGRRKNQEERVPTMLNKEQVRCLIKIDQDAGDWDFSARFIDEQDYLSALKGLELAVRRQKPDEFSDVLSITTHRVPESTVFTPPVIPVAIEIRDETDKLLESMKSQSGDSIEWSVPDDVGVRLRIIAVHTDASGKEMRSEFSCLAHSTQLVTPKIGHWQTYGVTDGLGGSGAEDIIADKNGVLWFGQSGEGISRYDGHTFRTFTTKDGLPSNDVWTLLMDSRGHLWVGRLLDEYRVRRLQVRWQDIPNLHNRARFGW